VLTKDASTFVGDRARAARRRHVVANVDGQGGDRLSGA